MRTLFVVADSVRADALGCYGGTAATPTVDALAAAGVRFERVVSCAPWTLPSLAGMLTGVYAHRLGLLKWEQPWPRSVPTLFDAFRARGVETASFVFDPEHLFRACPEASVVGSSQDHEALLAWLRARRHGSYFAFVHYWWTHVPYVPRKLPLATWHEVNRQILGLLSATDPGERRENRAKVRGLYAHAVHEMSEAWLPDVLEASNADVVVLIADHGESWGERMRDDAPLEGVFDLHGNHLHDEVIRVPWIVYAPALVRAAVVRGLARTVDVAPTLLELLGLEPLPVATSGGGIVERAGRSLASAALAGRVDGEPLAVCARNRDFLDAPAVPTSAADVYVELSCQDLASKVIAGLDGHGARAYDLVADPDERRPAPLLDERAAPLVRTLEEERTAAVVAPHDPGDFERMKTRLRSLGYV